MFVSAIGVNNFSFNGQNSAQNFPAQIKMRGALNADTVSFGNAPSKPMKDCIKMVKEIFTELNSVDKVAVEKQKESFTEIARSALNKIQQNLNSMKEADIPTRSTEIAAQGNTKIKAYKFPFMDGYIFEQYPKKYSGLVNSIEVSPEGNYAKILHQASSDEFVSQEARGTLGEVPEIISVRYFKSKK